MKHPDGLAGKLGFHTLQEAHEAALVARLHGLAAQKRQPAYVRGAHAFDELIFHLARERLAEVEVPGLGLEALRTVMCASAHEQRRTRARPIGNVAVFDLGVVHDHFFL